MSVPEQDQYNSFANDYARISHVPQTDLEHELVYIGLGDCTGCKVLDLGGGSGNHARQAAKAGAAHVDVVDISEQMLQIGQEMTAKEEIAGIDWHLGDISKALVDQLPVLKPNSYDLVMVIWTFDHARTVEELRSMWSNVSIYLKPGGRLLVLRLANLRAPSLSTGQYGARVISLCEIPDGLKYEVEILSQPPFSFEGTSMEISYTGSPELAGEFGIRDFQLLAPQETTTVKNDANFWQAFLEDPFFVVFTGTKKD